MSTAHTPGPWLYRERPTTDDARRPLAIYGPDQQFIAGLSTSALDLAWPKERANAQLIASAPDLLAALERICLLGATQQVGHAQEIARAAIEKAEGRSA